MFPVSKWLLGVHMMCAGKNGVSAHELHRQLGVTLKTAWFMSHRIRYAMGQEPLRSKMVGIIEADETYMGGKRRGTRNIDSENRIEVSARSRGRREAGQGLEEVGLALFGDPV